MRPSGGHEGTREHRFAPDTPDPETGRKEGMFKISAITRVSLVAVACVAVAAPSALAKAPAKGNAKSLYGYAMSYAPTKLTPEPAKPAKVQSLYGFAMSYTPTKATRKAAKPAKVQSLYGFAMSYTPTKATRKAAKPAKVQSLYGFAMSYTPTKATRKAATAGTRCPTRQTKRRHQRRSVSHRRLRPAGRVARRPRRRAGRAAPRTRVQGHECQGRHAGEHRADAADLDGPGLTDIGSDVRAGSQARSHMGWVGLAATTRKPGRGASRSGRGPHRACFSCSASHTLVSTRPGWRAALLRHRGICEPSHRY